MIEDPSKQFAAPGERKANSRKTDGHSLVAQSLKSLGVTHVYCIAGTPIRETFAKCAALGIRPIGVRQQQSGVLMALAQNYVTGGLPAVALFSAGPAITNAATGILVAQDNCWPLVVLGGRRPLDMRGMGSFQELDAVTIFQSITKWSALVEKTSEIPGYLARAFQIARSGRPGPVYLDLPEDVLDATQMSSAADAIAPAILPQPDNREIEQATDLLLSAQRPALIIGKGVRWSAPFAEMRRLVEEFDIPFITSPMGRGFLPDDHPLCANYAAGTLQRRADVILLLGARLDWTFRFGRQFARDTKLIQIDIHEPEIGTNRPAAVGIVGDVKLVLQKILDCMTRKVSTAPRASLALWRALLEAERTIRESKLDSQMRSATLPMSPQRMFKEIKDFLPRDAICILDGNVSMAAGQRVVPAYLPASRFTAGTNGCMGVGVPYAVGAKIAQPDRLAIAVCGDMGFAMSAMDMETAVRHKVPILVVVANNEGGTGAITQSTFFPNSEERITMFQPDIHYDNMMLAFGGHGEYVDRPEQLRPALERSVASGKAACINVKIDPFAEYPQD
ncbi:MAG: thiamine pyrophosphate-binding protein [Candidatus Binatia bacterium]